MKLTKIIKGGISLVATLSLLGYVVASEWNTVRAYTLIGATYPGQTVTYKVNPTFTDPSAGTTAQQITAIQAAADAWQSQSGIDFGFTYGGTTSIASVGFDGTNTVYYAPDDGGGALAVCYYWMGGGSMYQFDIEFFDRDGTYNFIWALTPSVTQFDIQSVATHEFGHALGLGHSAINGATMFPSVSPGDTSPRTLHADDIAGVQALYGVPGPTVNSCSPSSTWVDGGVTVTVNGANFSATNLAIQFGGQVASNPVFVSPTQVTCVCPAAPALGTVSVTVCCSGQCASGNVFGYDTIRAVDAPVAGGVSTIEFEAPGLGSKVYQGFASLGQAGIPLSQWADPLDQRVLPVTLDGILAWQIANPVNWFSNFNGQLNAQGAALGFFWVPNHPQISGVTFHFSWIVWDAQSQSGVGLVGNHTSVTVQ